MDSITCRDFRGAMVRPGRRVNLADIRVCTSCNRVFKAARAAQCRACVHSPPRPTPHPRHHSITLPDRRPSHGRNTIIKTEDSTTLLATPPARNKQPDHLQRRMRVRQHIRKPRRPPEGLRRMRNARRTRCPPPRQSFHTSPRVLNTLRARESVSQNSQNPARSQPLRSRTRSRKVPSDGKIACIEQSGRRSIRWSRKPFRGCKLRRGFESLPPAEDIETAWLCGF